MELSDDQRTEGHLVYTKFGFEILLPSTRPAEEDENPKIEPKIVINTEPELGPFVRNIDEHRGCGDANTLRKIVDIPGRETDTKFAPSGCLDGALQVKEESECQRDALHTEESRFAAMEHDFVPKYRPPTKFKVAPVPGGASAVTEETFCCNRGT